MLVFVWLFETTNFSNWKSLWFPGTENKRYRRPVAMGCSPDMKSRPGNTPCHPAGTIFITRKQPSSRCWALPPPSLETIFLAAGAKSVRAVRDYGHGRMRSDTAWLHSVTNHFTNSLRIDCSSRRRLAVVLGYASLRPLRASRTIPETIKRAFSLSSAGTAYQGA